MAKAGKDDYVSSAVSVLLGNGDGTFRSAVDYGADDDPYSVAIGDLDGDRVMDLAVANATSNNVSVLLGNGDGTFQSAVNYGSGVAPLSVAIGDLDGDDHLDLTVANGGSDDVAILINSLDIFETVHPKWWSMISLPVDPINKKLSTLFPGAVVAYGYDKGTGYVRVKPDDDLEVGRGYWILLDEEKTYTLTGQPIPSYTYPVSSDGWAMIGGCASLAWASPNHCNIDVIYRYVQGIGYQRITGPLEPGEGYWILLNDVDGQASLSIQGSGE